ncbi:MAG: S-layer homology domain-containing protein [Patescibacteria group bacterium]
MLKNKIKNFSYLAITVLSMIFVHKLELFKGTSDLISTSVLPVLENVLVKEKSVPPDLGIQNVSLKRISSPDENFNYYKYTAAVVIKNFGGNVENMQLKLNAGKDQQHLFVKNAAQGFTLEKGKSYIVENYELLFDGEYNGGKIKFEINLVDKNDYYLENNVYEVDVFDPIAKIENISVEEVLDDGSVIIDFETSNFGLNTDKFEIYTNNALGAKLEERYDETYTQNKFYSYFHIKNTKDLLEESGWEMNEINDFGEHEVKFSDDAFTDDKDHYIYIRAQNTESGNYAFSNILKLVPQKEMNRASFSKLFVDQAGIEVFDEGENYFEDVEKDIWYAAYVQTLYNLGLLKNDTTKYLPEKIMTRAEVLRVVLDYYDVDLIISSDAPNFEDVQESDSIYPYIEAMHSSGHAGIFGERFRPDSNANIYFLKYLINEYQKNS